MPRPDGEGSHDRVTVPCGKCGPCLSRKRNDWSFRLREEYRYAKSAYFLTLTYNDESLTKIDYKPEDPGALDPDCPAIKIAVLNKSDISKFIKDIRNFQKQYKFKTKLLQEFYSSWPGVRYYIVGEYGKQDRPHYHGLIFNLFPIIVNDKYVVDNQISCKLTDIWGKGFVKIGDITPASIHYCTKYFITKVKNDAWSQEVYKDHPEFTLMSRRPGIGHQFIDRVGDFYSEPGQKLYVKCDGYTLPMPKYYRDRLLTDSDKERYHLETQQKFDSLWRKKIEKKGLKAIREERKNAEVTSRNILNKAKKGRTL